MTQFTPEEVKNIRALLFRVDLKGTEAIVVGALLEKLNTLIPKEEPKKEEDKK